jgi:periplasmic divalent cation tolerance protein
MDDGNPSVTPPGDHYLEWDRRGACVVMTTLGSSSDAARIARHLVEGRLAACVQILPPMTSVYPWEGRVEEASEWLLLIKTLWVSYPALEAALREIHPYQIPEIIVLPIVAGLPAYLDWLATAATPLPPRG